MAFPIPYELVEQKIMDPSNSTNFFLSEKQSLELYITAPATIRLYHSFGLSGETSTSVEGYLTGQLISE
jgi:hypothetical protein